MQAKALPLPSLPSGTRHPSSIRDLYHASHLAPMFDRMVGEYWINEAFSMGMTHLWRRKAVQFLNLQPHQKVADLMCGTGENWRHLLSRIGPKGEINALDFSEGMLQKAERRKAKLPGATINLSLENALNSSLSDASQDAVITSFGLKTLNSMQMSQLAREIKRILRPGGRFALLELTLPHGKITRALHQWYFHHIMKPASHLLGLKQEPARMLETYLERFDPPEVITELLRQEGMKIQKRSLLGGFACLFYGSKE